MFSRTAARAVPTVCFKFVADNAPPSHRTKITNPQAPCASSFAKGTYAVSHGFADKLIIITKLSSWAP